MSDKAREAEYADDYPAVCKCEQPLLIEGELGPPCCDRCGGIVRLPLGDGA